MGLSHKPTYRVEADGNDITEAIRENLISLTITDEAGVKSDSLAISLHDRGYKLPKAGGQLKVWLGYGQAATFMGLYVSDEISLSGPPDKMDIKAAGAPQEKSAAYSHLQTQKTRSWLPQTIGALVATVSADHGLDPAVASDLSSVGLPHIDQINESDMHLLTRIAADHDAIAKANGGKLVFAHKGQGKTISGKAMPTVALIPSEVTNYRVNITARSDYNQVVAVWRSVELAEDVQYIAGAGEPVHRIRHIYPTPEAAAKAAKAKLEAFQRGKQSLSVSLPGRPELRAECRLSLSGFRDGVNGLWSVARATHKLGSGGYVTSVEGERV